MPEVFSFVLLTFVSSFTPGPNNSMVFQSGMVFGFRRTLPHISGITLGFFVMFESVRLGLFRLLETYPQIMLGLKIAGSFYFLYIAWRVLNLRPHGVVQQSALRPFPFASALLFQWVNVKAWLFALSANTLVPSQGHWGTELLLGGCIVFFTVIAVCCWTLLGQSLERLFSRSLYARLINAILSLSLVYVVFSWWQDVLL